MMDEVRHPESDRNTGQHCALPFEHRPRPEAVQLRIQVTAARRREFIFLRRIEPQNDSPADQDRYHDTREICEEPLTVQDAYVTGLFDDSAAENRRGTCDQHLVENCSGVRDNDEQAFSDIAAVAETKRLNGCRSN